MSRRLLQPLAFSLAVLAITGAWAQAAIPESEAALRARLEAEVAADAKVTELKPTGKDAAGEEGLWGMKIEFTTAYPATPSGELVGQVVAAIERILAPDSELKELWDEGGEDQEWHESIDDLRKRIRS